ncbi:MULTISPECIES: beta-ketoacyl-ACP synthase III [unclassified Modestobacter]|uniref:beta-ketoacyl-ACP synthase III n=1 Tax=unclassified Modestobacter TaxID=2643866 RepID=UPI0022AA375F|nr:MULTISPECIES: beta-ketoacyl-ACP synthase III [unclassified Modestobacter]MCZ2813113.1 ketoacyl-ACP synthase III [Modestobacter sp. VKM Ac-2979]MCZ2842858.1 ketoacyl-ACP synthase III [Modestobacter sp. VKM Ac-2980]MCZ2847468.1 ketoacyl-ACP synthase III [Modestobacter sp. VKM Ac-2978]
MTTIKLREGAPGASILGLGSYRPRRRVTNDELAQVMDTNDEWIQSRVGIAERRWASEDETLVDMSIAAGGKALAASGLAPDQIDLVIVASASLTAPIPGIGPQVAHRLGIPRPGAFDLNAGCAGFCYALSVAADAIRTGEATNVLVVGVERLSDVTDQTDRSTAVIFADGAGAAVLGPTDEPGIGPVAWGSDGDQYTAIEIAAGRSTMTMAGQTVYRWATTKLTQTLIEAMEKAGVTAADIDVFAPHQANLRIIESMAKKLGFSEDTVIARDVVQSGNTSAASVPLALTALMESGEAKSGDLALVLGYGAGLTFAGQVLRLP